MASIIASATAFAASLGAFLYQPIILRYEVLGIGRSFKSIDNIHGEGMRLLSNKMSCEDMHLHESSKMLFAACEEKRDMRLQWFPPYVSNGRSLSQ